MRRLALGLLLLATPAVAAPLADHPLAKLAKSLVPAAGQPGLEIAEVVAFRDVARSPTAQGVAIAAALEQGIDDKDAGAPRAYRALVGLALSFTPLDGPNAEWYGADFWPGLLRALNLKPDEAQERPDLPKELAAIGEWGAATVERLLPKLTPDEASAARVVSAYQRGKFAEVVTLARAQLKKGPATSPPTSIDPIWQAWLAAGLTLTGAGKEAEPYAAAAIASGSEAEAIWRNALGLHARLRATDRTRAALKSARFAASGPTQKALHDACRKLIAEAKPSAAVASAAAECGTLLPDDGDVVWLKRAAELAPKGAAGATVRAARLLAQLFGVGETRADATARVALNRKYQDEVKLAKPGANAARLLSLLGHLSVAEDTMHWLAVSADEKRLLAELAASLPCDAGAFALQAMATRNDCPALGKLVSATVERCADAPGGAGVTLDAAALAILLGHEIPPLVDATALAPRIERFARAHPDDAEALALSADLAGLKAFAGGRKPAPGDLQAALDLYEAALLHNHAVGGATLRPRLAGNAAFLADALANQYPEKDEKRNALLQRAIHHALGALALGEPDTLVAIHVQLDADAHLGATVPSLDLTKRMPSHNRSRAACMMAREAATTGDAEAWKRWRDLALEGPPPADDHPLDTAELLDDTTGTFRMLTDEVRMQPYMSLRSMLYLAPACDPTKLVAPKPKATAK